MTTVQISVIITALLLIVLAALGWRRICPPRQVLLHTDQLSGSHVKLLPKNLSLISLLGNLGGRRGCTLRSATSHYEHRYQKDDERFHTRPTIIG